MHINVRLIIVTHSQLHTAINMISVITEKWSKRYNFITYTVYNNNYSRCNMLPYEFYVVFDNHYSRCNPLPYESMWPLHVCPAHGSLK